MLQIVADGQQPETPIQVANGLSFPEGLVIDKNKNRNLLVVVTGAERLSWIDTKTEKVRTVAENLAPGFGAIPGSTPTYIFSGVAVGQSGVIYVTNDVTNILYRIEPKPWLHPQGIVKIDDYASIKWRRPNNPIAS